MATAPCVRTILTTRIARVIAAVIIVLAISPFTAPFSTFDAAELLSEQVVHAGVSQAKTAQHLTDCAVIPAGASPLLLDDIVDSARASDLVSIHPVRVVVLRI